MYWVRFESKGFRQNSSFFMTFFSFTTGSYFLGNNSVREKIGNCNATDNKATAMPCQNDHYFGTKDYRHFINNIKIQ